MTTKRCSKCKEEKSIECFCKNKSRKDGLNHTCRPCSAIDTKEWKLRNPEKTKGMLKKWKMENPEKYKEMIKKYRLNNPEKFREKNKRYFLKNPEKVREIHRNTPSYISRHLGFKSSKGVPQELLDLKRIQLQLYREIRKQNG